MMIRSPLLNIMVRSTTHAAKGLRRDLGEVRHLQNSKHGLKHFIETAKKRIFKTIKDEVVLARPDFSFFNSSRMFGDQIVTLNEETTNTFFVLEPLFAMDYFRRGVATFGVSLLAVEGEKPIACVCYQPIENELYTAEVDSGVFQNDKRHLIGIQEAFKNCHVIIEAGSIRDNNRESFFEFSKHISNFTFPNIAKEHIQHIYHLVSGFSDLLISCAPSYAHSQSIKVFVTESGGFYKEYDLGFPLLIAGNAALLEQIDPIMEKFKAAAS